jgi:hypothetical protein
MKNSNLITRISGIAGILGGLLLFAGDMLYYYNGASIDLKFNMANSSDFRIEINGIIALLSTWLYLLGVISIYYAFAPASKKLRNIVLMSFTGILTSYGIIHGAYIAIATTAKLALHNNLDIVDSSALAVDTNNLMRLIIYPIFAVFSFVFIWQVWKKKTLYPRWILIFFPLTTFVFQGFLKQALSGSTWVIVNGGFLNIILVIFFTASTIALWNKTTPAER